MMAFSGFMILIVVILLFVLVVGAILVVTFALRNRQDQTPVGPQPGSKQAALDILKERYAHGEITREEYADIRRDLES